MNNFYVKYKGPISVILILILLGGTYSLLNIQSGLFPDITFPKVKIIADNGEQPVDKMMVTVTAIKPRAITNPGMSSHTNDISAHTRVRAMPPAKTSQAAAIINPVITTKGISICQAN